MVERALPLRILPRDAVEITGFGGLVERIYLMDESTFGHHRQESAWSGWGALQYVAHAHFRPRGETGMHQHQNVNIVTIVTEGTFLHRGSLGDGLRIQAGEVLIQHAGTRGFQHNEINPLDSYSRMIQLWLAPDNDDTKATYQLIDVSSRTTRIYQSDTMTLDIIQLTTKQDMPVDQPFLAYLYHGTLCIEGNTLSEGTLFSAGAQRLESGDAGATILLATVFAIDNRIG